MAATVVEIETGKSAEAEADPEQAQREAYAVTAEQWGVPVLMRQGELEQLIAAVKVAGIQAVADGRADMAVPAGLLRRLEETAAEQRESIWKFHRSTGRPAPEGARGPHGLT